MGTFSRLRYVIAANVNALLEKAEDPEKLLRALIREMEDAGEEARAASADLLAEQRHLERRLAESETEIGQWQARAERAVAEERDDLARAALAERTAVDSRCAAIRREQQHLHERLTALETDMATLKQKLAEAKARLRSLAARPAATAGRGPARQPSSPAERKVQRAFGRFDRLQAQVENLEARVQSYETGGPAPETWKAQAASDPAVEAELERLKQRLGESTAGDGPAKAAAGTAD